MQPPRRASVSRAGSSRNLLVGISTVVAVLLLYSKAIGSRSANLVSDSDPAVVLAKSRRATLEAKWAQRRAHADFELRLAREQQQEAASPTEKAGALNPAAEEPPAAAAAAAEQVASGGNGCNVPPRPYHTILTSSSGGYQAWQCRVMHHHWKLQKARDPCGEMGGFTRLLTSPNEQPDAYAEEIPTVVVKEARAAGYVVVNRPHSMVLFLQSPHFAARVTEEYVYIAETDHLMLRPMPNLATRHVPAGFNFGYMVAWGQASVVDKFVPGLGGKTDPVGPSPVIIHVEQLKQVTPLWHDFTRKIMADPEAVLHLGWVREMWGYCIAAASLGIKHRVMDALQYEGGSIGNRERRLSWPTPALPVTPEGAVDGAGQGMPYYLFHYTYGIEYSKEGLPVELQVGEWSLDKRHYMGGGPPRDLAPPPTCAHDRAFVLRALWNNASASLAAAAAAGGGGKGWDFGRDGDLSRFNHWDYRDHPLRSTAAAAQLLGTGPWKLSGRAGGVNFRIERVYLMANGWLVARRGHGRWGLRAKAGGGWEEGVIVVKVCGVGELVLRPSFGETSWTLASDPSGTPSSTQVRGQLEAGPAAIAAWSAPPRTPTDTLSLRIEGSGAYRGLAWRTGEAFLLRAGVLQLDGGPSLPFPPGDRARKPLTRWLALDGKRVALGAATDSEEALRSYAAGLQVAFLDCYTMRFVQPPDAAAANTSGTSPLPPLPLQYSPGAEKASMEWIIKPKAAQCEDACGGMTLRRLTTADRAASALARAVEGCGDGCGWAWSGKEGLRFLPGGQLKTPWGEGLWGAPPEGQAGQSPALLAEFAGHQHLLRASLGGGREVQRMASTRCSDNDRATVTLTRGKAALDA